MAPPAATRSTSYTERHLFCRERRSLLMSCLTCGADRPSYGRRRLYQEPPPPPNKSTKTTMIIMSVVVSIAFFSFPFVSVPFDRHDHDLGKRWFMFMRNHFCLSTHTPCTPQQSYLHYHPINIVLLCDNAQNAGSDRVMDESESKQRIFARCAREMQHGNVLADIGSWITDSRHRGESHRFRGRRR